MLGQLETWTYGGGPGKPEELARYIDERLRALSLYLASSTRLINHGPLHGAYFPLLLRVDKHGATLAAGNEGVPTKTHFNLTPRFISAAVDTGRVTLQLRDGATDLLVAALDTGVAEPYWNVHSAFTVSKVAKTASLRLRVVSVVSGAPTQLEALVIFSHAQKVDDPQI